MWNCFPTKFFWELREQCRIVFIPSLCQLPINTQMGFKGSFVLRAHRAAVFALSVNNAVVYTVEAGNQAVAELWRRAKVAVRLLPLSPAVASTVCAVIERRLTLPAEE